MPRLVTYRCPDCNGQFDFLHHPSDEPPPPSCELCGSYMGDDPEPAPVLNINVGKDKNKVGDKLYRQMEDATNARIEEAAEMTGADVSELSGMKMTNMKDNMRAGDTSAPSITAAEERLTRNAGNGIKIAPQMQNFGRPPANKITPQAQELIAGTTAGQHALSTRRAISQLQDTGRHHANVSRMTAAGQLGKH